MDAVQREEYKKELLKMTDEQLDVLDTELWQKWKLVNTLLKLRREFNDR